MEKMLNSEMIQYIAALLTISAVLIRTVETIMCIYLIEETENIGASKCKFVKQMKLKFENSCKLNSDMRNVEAFVIRSFEKYKFLNISMRGMEVISNSIKMLLIIGGFIEFSFKRYMGSSFAESIIVIEYTVGAVLMVFLAEIILDSGYKKKMVINNFVDFFDNTLMDRMRYERNILEEEELAKNSTAATESDIKEESENIRISKGKISKTSEKKETSLSEEPSQYDKEVIQDILNQFLA